MKHYLKLFSTLLVVICVCIPLVLCMTGCTEAERVSYNISKEADNFNSYRRVIVIDCITGDVLFTVEGWISINADTTDHQLEIIAEVGKSHYKKHFIGLSDNVSYTVEDLDGSDVDRYQFAINYNPRMWIPFTLQNID